MVNVKRFEHFFKPEVRNRGEVYLDNDEVYLLKMSDTEVTGVIKATQPIRVSLTAKSIADNVFTVSCSCNPSQKGQLCKHIWGTILTTALDYPDFFENKNDLVKVASDKDQKTKLKVAPSESQLEFKEKLKAKQSAHRKAQYQKLKNSKKEKRTGAKSSLTFDETTQKALEYFAQNGFEFEQPIDVDELRSAKKLLSRIFHPDKGGTHEEVLELNRNFELLLNTLVV